MSAEKRPLPVTILGWVYIVVGTTGFAYHFTDFQARNRFRYDDFWIELVRFLAIICGAFMLRGHNWARWLAVAWIVFHVILSAFHTVRELAIHCLFCAVIVWFLFRPEAARYFRGSRIEPT
jgi:nicotinamide riboside transporter PnuC